MKAFKLIFALLISFFVVTSSVVQAQDGKRMSRKSKGTIIGAGAGVVGGAVVGGTKGALIGGAAGAVGGRILGKRSDRKKAERARQQQQVVTTNRY